ncbi:MAG: hypothetical protein QXP70_04210 [Methanomassiliicoccales archaeon]
MTSDPDIQKKIDESQGLIKKIQLVVPGFRGYRELEDMRAADQLLRFQVGDIVKKAEANISDFRRQMVSKGQFFGLEPLQSLMSDIQQLYGAVVNAEEGYSGISPAIRVTQQTLASLYSYDLTFVEAAKKLLDATSAKSQDSSAYINTVQQLIESFRDAWQKRIEAVEQILVNGGQQHG